MIQASQLGAENVERKWSSFVSHKVYRARSAIYEVRLYYRSRNYGLVWEHLSSV